MKIDLLIHSASQLLTLTPTPQRGNSLGDLGIIPNGALAVDNGQILDSGSSKDLLKIYDPAEIVDAAGKIVLPGFVDPHTHLVWAGDRALEFEQRLDGKSYMEIMEAGGGIVSTVKQTRAASVEQLVRETLPRLNQMLNHGTTTVEAKSGYGLDTETEIKILEAVLRLDKIHPVDIIPTFLGAHAVPPEYTGRTDAYADLVITDMLPAVKTWWLEKASYRPLPFVDVFCEEGAFNLEQTRRILEAARNLDFPLKIHADEFKSLGGTALAVSLNAASADHLVATSENEINQLGKSDTVAVALPNTPFGLAAQAYTPAKQIIKAGGILALASDLNPGTAWSESMQFPIALACRYMRLTPAQAIAAATINAAAALKIEETAGSLTPGKQADIIILTVPDYRHLGYRFGVNLVGSVYKKGQIYTDLPKS